MLQDETPRARNGEALVPLPKFVRFITENGTGPPLTKFGKINCFERKTREGPLLAVIEDNERGIHEIEISNITEVV